MSAIENQYSNREKKRLFFGKGKKLLPAMMLMGLIICGCDENKSDVVVPAQIDAADHDSIVNGSAIKKTVIKEEIGTSQEEGVAVACHNVAIVNAFAEERSNLQVKGCGTVIAVLEDDNKGSRHQRFIVSLDDIEPNLTILIAHNIDLAPRVANLQKGNSVIFYGEYEFNPKGGVIHWTHHDPAARHQNGWIEKDGRRYQ